MWLISIITMNNKLHYILPCVSVGVGVEEEEVLESGLQPISAISLQQSP